MVKRAELERSVGSLVLLGRQGDPKGAAGAGAGERGEAFAEAAGAGEEVDDGDGVGVVGGHGSAGMVTGDAGRGEPRGRWEGPRVWTGLVAAR